MQKFINYHEVYEVQKNLYIVRYQQNESMKEGVQEKTIIMDYRLRYYLKKNIPVYLRWGYLLTIKAFIKRHILICNKNFNLNIDKKTIYEECKVNILYSYFPINEIIVGILKLIKIYMNRERNHRVFEI